MRKFFVFLTLVIQLFAFMSTAYGASAKTAPGANEQSAEKALKQTFPMFNFTNFRKTPVQGIYEVDMGGQVIYFSPQGYLFFGDLYSKAGQNLTAERKQKLMAAVAKDLPLNEAIKIGNGPKKVVEFADPVCPFCRRAYAHLAKRKDVTEYVFLFPLAQIHPQAAEMSKYIFCSADPAKAFDQAMRGELDGKKLAVPAGCTGANSTLDEDIGAGKKAGVSGTPAFFINGRFVNGANLPLIDKLLASK